MFKALVSIVQRIVLQNGIPITVRRWTSPTQAAAIARGLGCHKDAERLLAAQAKRDRKAAKRRHHAVVVIDDGGYIVRAGGAAMLNDGAYEPVPT